MKYTFFLILLITIAVNATSQANSNPDTSWCNHPPRDAFKKLKEIKISNNWFKVYSVGDDVIAIYEPYNFEEVVSYLILGKTKALLFDTGLGLESISPVIKQLTNLPVTVINSHTHYDHIGGNHEFENILAMNTSFTIKNSKEGWGHDAVKHEVTTDAFCLQKLPGTDTAHYHIRPFKISQFVKDGDEIDLGGRKLQIISVPGHTPDAIALLDRTNGYLWTGDTFYEGPIYLFAEATDLPAYEKSIATLARLVPILKVIFPSHNNPVCDPERLTALKDDFAKVKTGEAKGADDGKDPVLIRFQYFDFLIGRSELEKFVHH